MTVNSCQWSRRKFLRTGVGVSAVGLAGCAGKNNQGNNSGNGSGSSSSGGNSGGGTGGKQVFSYPIGRAPTDVQFNPYNVANWGQTLQDQFFHQIARGYADGTIGSEFLEDISVDGKTLTLKFPKGFKWWSGKDLTAEDCYVGFEIDRLQDPSKSDVEKNELSSDKYTLKTTYKKQVTPTLAKAKAAEAFVNTPRWIYQDYLDRLQKASSQSDRDKVTKDLISMKITAQDVIDKGVGNGLYKLTAFNSSKSVMKKFKDHPYADRTSIEEVHVIPQKGSDLKSLISSNKLDMQPNTLINQVSRSYFPDNCKNVYKYNWFRMQKFTFNWKNEHLAKRPVRRAILHAVDLNPVVNAMVQAGTTGTPIKTQTGLRPSIYEKYLGKGFADKLIDYPVKADSDGATKLMQQAGYSKKGKNWVDPNGKSFSLKVLTQNQTEQVQATKVFNDQLNNFGIQTEVNTVDSTSYYQKLQNYTADIYWIWHVAVALWHPIAYFSNNFYGVLAGDPSSGKKTGPTGVPFSLRIPKTVGAKEIQGDGQTIHPAKLMNDLPSATSADQVQQMTRTLCQWFNFDLPGIVFVKENAGYWGDTSTFSFPDGKQHKLNTDRPGQVAIKNGWIDQK